MHTPGLLIIKHISILYRSEIQLQTYTRVFQRKACSVSLNKFLAVFIEQSESKILALGQLLNYLGLEPEDVSSDGIRGIFKEGFKKIEESCSVYQTDSSIIFSLKQGTYYMLDHYRTLLFFIHTQEDTDQIEIVDKIIQMEESLLRSLDSLNDELHADTYSTIRRISTII